MNAKELSIRIENLGTDHLPTFGGKFEGGIHLQQVPEEVANCLCKIREIRGEKTPLNFLEIGAAAGGTTYVFNAFLTLKNIVLVDDNQHKKHGLRHEILQKVPRKELIGNSHAPEAVDRVRSLGLMYDIIIIDGDHSYAGVKQDFVSFSQFLNRKGLVIFHDTVVCPGVAKFVEELGQDRCLGHYVGSGSKKLGIMLFEF